MKMIDAKQLGGSKRREKVKEIQGDQAFPVNKIGVNGPERSAGSEELSYILNINTHISDASFFIIRAYEKGMPFLDDKTHIPKGEGGC